MPSRDIALDLPLRITRTANQQRTYQYCYDYHRKVKDLHLEGMTTFVYPALMGFITTCSIPIRLCHCPSSVLPARFRHSPPSISFQCPRVCWSLASFCPRCEVFFKAPEYVSPIRGVLPTSMSVSWEWCSAAKAGAQLVTCVLVITSCRVPQSPPRLSTRAGRHHHGSASRSTR